MARGGFDAVKEKVKEYQEINKTNEDEAADSEDTGVQPLPEPDVIGFIGEIQKDQFQQVKPVQNVRTTQKNMKQRRHSGNTLMAIALPYPDSFSESSLQSWSQSKGIMGTMGSKIEDMNIPLLGMNQSKFIGQVQNTAGIRKPIQNPGYFQDYEGPSPREFSFSWTFMPHNSKEANDIQLIIFNLKKFSSPQESLVGSVLLQPFSFNISLKNDTIGSSQNMDLMVCKDIQVDWGTKSELFQDGVPKQVKLTMRFQERASLTQNDYQ